MSEDKYIKENTRACIYTQYYHNVVTENQNQIEMIESNFTRNNIKDNERESWRCIVWDIRGWGGKQDQVEKNTENNKRTGGI